VERLAQGVSLLAFAKHFKCMARQYSGAYRLQVVNFECGEKPAWLL
jgi:hypothetical protein